MIEMLLVPLLSVGPNEMLILLILALLLILGPSKIPELARGFGEAVREFKKAMEGEYEEEKPKKREEKEEKKLTDEQIREIAKRLGIETEGKTREELEKEIVAKAKEEKLTEE
ncbi:translocase [Ignicoccus islandicus DSM 13165]|uniref:Translocase n=2 Tax=Ignicoccus islandicus TaxID=54259 RepID=A0A0U3FIE5_9CREN|nr:translocase [Ignicoccus islandicus DSM 13165]